MDFKKEMGVRAADANRIIEAFLPDDASMPGSLLCAMRYSVTAGGKRIRPVLMKEAYTVFGGTGHEIEPFMAAMEYIHTSSLVHDDLPSIDNDELRRGVKTTHARFGEALGVLAGDALLNLAYETLLSGIVRAADQKRAAVAAEIIARKSGWDGMLGGQSVDVENEKKGLDIVKTDMLDFIYEKKTSALLEASLMAGGALAGASDRDVAVLGQIGGKLGLAFQIRDDILDVTGDAETLGKPVFSDEQNGKETYVTLMGLEKSAEKVRELTKEAVRLIDILPGDTAFLKELFLQMAERRK